MKLEIPRCDEGPWRWNELSVRKAKPEPARVMGLELPHRYRIRVRISGFAGFGDCQNNERAEFLA